MMNTLRRLRWIAHDLRWAIIHRLHPGHRYHIIKTGLKPGYYDADSRMYHAIITLLFDFIEKEKPYDHFVTEGPDAYHPEEWKRLKELYEYFKADKDPDSLETPDYEEKTAMLMEVVSLRKMLWT